MNVCFWIQNELLLIMGQPEDGDCQREREREREVRSMKLGREGNLVCCYKR